MRFTLTLISAAIRRQTVFKIKKQQILWNQINEKLMLKKKKTLSLRSGVIDRIHLSTYSVEKYGSHGAVNTD